MSLDYKGLLPDSVGAVKVQASTPKIKPKMELDYGNLLLDTVKAVKVAQKLTPKSIHRWTWTIRDYYLTPSLRSRV